MTAITLLNSTGHWEIDNILAATIGICETAFPDQIRSYCIAGSYATGTATLVSDLDLSVIFKKRLDHTEREKASQLSRYCSQLNKNSGFAVREEPSIDPIKIVALKLNSLLLYGEDIKERLSLPSMENYVWETMNNGWCSFAKKIRKTSCLVYPVDYPEPNDPFMGYFQTGRTKDLVQSVFWAITGLLALKLKKYVKNREEALDLYKTHIGDEWTEYLEMLYGICRNELAYQIPGDEENRDRLHQLCRRSLEFENQFLQTYREYVLSELRGNVERGHKLRIIESLSKVIFPDQEVKDALKMVTTCGDIDVQHSATEVSERIKKTSQ